MTATLATWLNRPIPKIAVPSATMAVMSGNAMPSSEPKAMRMMMPAATTPIASLLEGGVMVACSMAWPPIATSRPGLPAALVRAMTCSTSGLGSWLASFVKSTAAKAVLPSRLIWAAPAGE